MIQIAPLPPAPVTQTGQTPQTVTSVLPGAQGQAVAPITANAVTPSSKTGEGQKVRRKPSDKRQYHGKEKETDEKSENENRGGKINISV